MCDKSSLFSDGFGKLLAFTAIVLGLMGCTGGEVEIELVNPLDETREDAQIVISRDSLIKHSPQLAEGSLKVIDSNGKKVPYQLDDLDGNGEWDELALIYSLPPESSRTIFIRPAVVDTGSSFEKRAQVWFAKRDSATGNYTRLTSEIRPDGYERVMEPPFYYQFEGPGWENDNVGFRLYFDERNGIDIWGKKTDEMVLQNVGKGDDYHSMADWGMDILKVGNSLGAGAIGVKVNDKLHRLQNTRREKFEQIADGPVRAIFDLTYRGWNIEGQKYDIRQKISIWAGSHGYQNKVSLLSSQDSLDLVAGVVTSDLKGKPEFGTGTSFDYIIAPDVQSADDANLGLGLLSMSDQVTSSGAVGKTGGSVEQTAFLEFDLTKDRPVHYRLLTGWETSDDKFGKSEEFKHMVISTGNRMENPVRVNLNQ